MKDPNDYNVRAVERALQILDCFDDEHPERGISDISLAVDLHKSTTHRIVTTLLNHGYLERAEDDQRYRLGLQLASLGYKVIQRVDARQEALPFMNEMVKKWDETCDLSIFDQDQVFYLEVLYGTHALSITATVGQRLPAHCTASGKLFLAHLTPTELEGYFRTPLKKHTENTIISPDVLRKQFDIILKQGYSYDDEELELGVRAIAAPIRSRDGKVIAAISIPGPINRMIPKRVSEISRSLMETTNKVSLRMGWKI